MPGSNVPPYLTPCAQITRALYNKTVVASNRNNSSNKYRENQA